MTKENKLSIISNLKDSKSNQKRNLVYAKSISKVDVMHGKFLKNKVVAMLLPKVKIYIEKWWQKRMEWAL